MVLMHVPYSRPTMKKKELRAAAEVLASGQLTAGPRVREFEQAFASYVGAEHAVATGSGTAALFLALRALGVSGAEVLVPSLTFAATANAVVAAGGVPVLVDVDRRGHIALRSEDVTERTRVVVPVHYGGEVVRGVDEFAQQHGLEVVADAAHGVGSFYDGSHVGTGTVAAMFSFQATKTITTAGEGGMLVTDNLRLADCARELRWHGIRRAAEGPSWDYEVCRAGYKLTMTELQGAVGLVQLGRVDEFLARRREIAMRYQTAFGAWALHGGRPSSWHLFVVCVRDRDAFIRRLGAEGVETSVHWKPLHEHRQYRAVGLPVATRLGREIVSLPIYPSMTTAQVEHVVRVTKSALRIDSGHSPNPTEGAEDGQRT